MAINSDPQDGIDAARRARRDSGRWHPIMAAREVEPGHWVMVDETRKPYGVIRFVRRGDQVGYRGDMWPAADGQDGEFVGYFTNLRAATFAVHRKFIASLGGQNSTGEYGRVR